MLIRSAIDFGVPVYVMETQPNVSAAPYTTHFSVGDCLNYDDVITFGEKVDIITIEKEAVNTRALKELQKRGKKVYPDTDLIETIQDKWLQKQALIKAGLPVAQGHAITHPDELEALAHQLPFIVKTRRNGYDGYGVQLMRSKEDFKKAFPEPSLTETLIDIEHEIAVMIARNTKGETT